MTESVIHDVTQGSKEWHTKRLGIPTASQFHRIITAKKMEPSKQARQYMYELIAERLLGVPMGHNIDHLRHVQDGKDREPYAARQLELVAGEELMPIGFMTTDNGRVGASPDRAIIRGNRRCGVEIKCPTPPTQVAYLLDGLGDDYKAQVQGQMWVGQFDEAIFFSYHPSCPPFHIITQRDDKFLAHLIPMVRQFCVLLDAETERARKKGIWLMEPEQE